VPYTDPQQEKPSSSFASTSRRRTRTLNSSVIGRRSALVGVVAGLTILAGAGSAYAASSWPTPSAQLSGDAALALAQPVHPGQPVRSARPPSAQPAAPTAKAQRKSAAAKPAAPPVYRNPLRDLHGLLAERVDMGADFGGSGPIYAIGNGVVTNAIGDTPGWPGGGWITYRLTSGPAAGQQVYVAEDVRPAVQVGQHVTSNTVIAHMFVGGSGIETGWAMPDGSSAESQLPVAGSVSGGGPFPTRIGLNFDRMLIALGVPAGFGYPQSGGYGTMPAGYPTSWTSFQRR
jgi:murein DD-endopeptidase MepM/ murein hydrolase activator NlpD